ncbi:hypothetical protein GGI23_006251 [Coemansia sp. RSA 2559]|nr:hypothetical protein GGI23_006251 [Coemansia sp. RSA 2559]KAJ2854225.1 hypothetical protein GGI22_004569 [Coemansia erecta]
MTKEEGNGSNDDVVTAFGYLQKQADLEREAAEVLPGKFDECTFDRGYIRQPLYACLTCTHPPAKFSSSASARAAAKEETLPAGMCYSCSIECHSGHEVVELFTKRNFRCDCGTKRMLPQTNAHSSCCSLKKTRTALARLENTGNVYNHNFWGFYCRCNKFYDPENEPEEMVLCYVCNDWFHASCIGVMPKEGEYEDYICRKCAASHAVLRYINTRKMKYGLISQDGLVVDIVDCIKGMAPLDCDAPDDNESDDNEPVKKKVRLNPCRLHDDRDAIDGQKQLDLFMEEGWTADVCTCIDCMREIETNKLLFLLKEEEIIEPEEDEARGESLYESALKQMQTMDHTRAIDAALAYRTLSAKLMDFLRPFASNGKVVTNQDIQSFFEQQRDAR